MQALQRVYYTKKSKQVLYTHETIRIHVLHALSGGTRNDDWIARSAASCLRHWRAVGAATEMMNRRLPTAVIAMSLRAVWAHGGAEGG